MAWNERHLNEISTLLDPFLFPLRSPVPSTVLERAPARTPSFMYHGVGSKVGHFGRLSIRHGCGAGPLLAQLGTSVRFSSCGRRWHESRSNLASSSRPSVISLSLPKVRRERELKRVSRDSTRKEGIILARSPHTARKNRQRGGCGHE